jgi:hypothetical protein
MPVILLWLCMRGAVETLQAGIDPAENRERFEANDLIITG